MLKFSEYHYPGGLRIEVTIDEDPAIHAGDLRKFEEGKYWYEVSNICLFQEELEQIVNKLKELNK